jgi:hypothetical protein
MCDGGAGERALRAGVAALELRAAARERQQRVRRGRGVPPVRGVLHQAGPQGRHRACALPAPRQVCNVTHDTHSFCLPAGLEVQRSRVQILVSKCNQTITFTHESWLFIYNVFGTYPIKPKPAQVKRCI